MKYDVLIIGGGPAGYTAAIYSARYKLKTAVIAQTSGGLLAEAHLVENWPGYKSIKGAELMNKIREQVIGLGADIIDEEVLNVVKKDSEIIATTRDNIYTAKAIILATGTQKRKLGVEGEKEFLGRGVSYCAVCDGAFFKDKVVAVIGGSDSAAHSAQILAEYAKKVYIIYRKEVVRCEPFNREKLEKDPKIKIINLTNVVKINGEGVVKSVTLDREYNGSNELALDGVFIEIGTVPNNALTKDLNVEFDKNGYIKVDNKQQTNVHRVFAAGDITNGSGKFLQAITAASEGAIAAKYAYECILHCTD